MVRLESMIRKSIREEDNLKTEQATDKLQRYLSEKINFF